MLHRRGCGTGGAMITRHRILIHNKCSNMYCRYVRITWLVDRQTSFMVLTYETHFFDVWIGIRIFIVHRYFCFTNPHAINMYSNTYCEQVFVTRGGGGPFVSNIEFQWAFEHLLVLHRRGDGWSNSCFVYLLMLRASCIISRQAHFVHVL